MSQYEGQFNPELQSKIQGILSTLNSLRNDWSAEIPEEIKHSTSDEQGSNNFKVRSTWFQQIIWAYEELDFIFGVNLPLDLKNAFDDFYIHVVRQRKDKTTPDQIEAGDKILDSMINFLREKF